MHSLQQFTIENSKSETTNTSTFLIRNISTEHKQMRIEE